MNRVGPLSLNGSIVCILVDYDNLHIKDQTMLLGYC